jgi:hypothetical protein
LVLLAKLGCYILHAVKNQVFTTAQCKLPVREPDGTLNKNGVHAAAAALAGARGGVDAPLTEKRKAARKLLALYRKLEEEPPASIQKLAG